ncbi:ABC-2 family transporter protein [Candidatus Dojkabacteria bacterium]|nr:ABC-2 family transporter protein [Candidatus Dojkabacteria bacterium]
MYLSSELAYRWQVFVWVVSDAIQPLLLGIVWVAVARAGGGVMNVAQTISYFFMVAIISKFTKDFSMIYISNSVISGEFSKYLVKPFNYLSETLGISIAVRILRIAFLAPILVIAYFFLKGNLVYDFSIVNTLLFVSSVIIGFSLNYLLGNTFALSAFFISQVLGLRAFYENVITFLSGEGIPLSAFPLWALVIVKYLPFRYTISFPIEILMGTLNRNQMIEGFVISLIWLLALMVVYRVLFKSAIKKYESVGI